MVDLASSAPDLAAYKAMMRERMREEERRYAAAVKENERLRGILTKLLTPPLRFGDKRDLVEEGRLIIEGWVE